MLAFGNAARRPAQKGLVALVIGSAMSYCFFCFLLGAVGCENAWEGALWGLAFGLFFDSGLNVSHSFFEERSFELFAIHRGEHAVGLTLAGALLGQLCGKGQAT